MQIHVSKRGSWCNRQAITWTNVLLVSIDLIHKSQIAPAPYPTIPHSEQKCAYFCSEWGIVGHGTGAFWDLWNCSIWPLGTNSHVVHVCVFHCCCFFSDTVTSGDLCRVFLANGGTNLGEESQDNPRIRSYSTDHRNLRDPLQHRRQYHVGSHGLFHWGWLLVWTFCKSSIFLTYLYVYDCSEIVNKCLRFHRSRKYTPFHIRKDY